MPWLSRNSFTPTDKLHADDLNNLANDDRTWGGDVNGGGYTLSNVNIVALNPQGAGGSVFSVFGRNGDVVAQAGDYTAAQVGAVPITRQVIAGAGMTGGGPLSADVTLNAAVTSVFGRTGAISLTPADITNATGVLSTRQVKTAVGSGLQGGGPLSSDLNLSVVPDSSNQQIQVMSQGSPIGSPRHAINFISGSGALVTVSEITASNRIDVTVASTGTGGFVDPTQILGDLIVRGLSAPPTRLAVGTDGQVLTADHLQALGMKWATPSGGGLVTSVFGRAGVVVAATGDYSAAQITNAVDQTAAYVNPPWITSLPWAKVTNPPAFMLDPTAAKGDIIVHGSSGTTNLPAGADGSVLFTDSSMLRGVKWGALPVTSVFGRAGGAVAAQSGDYTVAQVTGAVPNTTTVNTAPGSGLSGGGNLSGNLSLAVLPDTTNQRVQILSGGTAVGQPRPKINFTSGAGVALTITDNTVSNWIDITIASSGTGSGGGLVDPTSHVGDLIVRNANLPAPPVALPIGANGQVLTVDLAQAAGMKWAAPSGGGGSQTPWVGNVDAAAFNLNNVGGVGINIASNKTVARILAFVNATEDGFRATNSNAAGVASASCVNDIGDSVYLRSYGSGFVGALPGIATVEATNALAFLANAAEVMRLHSGRVLIGTTTDDGVNALQVNGKVKSLTGGFVFPDNTVQTTAYTAASSPVTSVFTRTGAVVALAGDYTAAKVTNAVDSSSTYNNPSWITSLAWSKITGAPALLVDPTTQLGDLIARGTAGPATRLGVGTNGQVLTADSGSPQGVKWAATPAQTPWLSNIDGGNFYLGNVARIGIANSAIVLPDGNASNPALIVGVTATGSTAGEITMCGNAASGSMGVLNFANYANAASDKRIALILGQTDGAANSGALSFFTYSAGNLAEKMRITAAGLVGIGAVAPAYPLDVRSVAPNYTVLHLNGNTGNDSGLYFVSIGGSSGIVGCGAAYSGSGWIAKVASPCTFGDNSVNLFQVNCDSGLTVGATYSPTPRLTIDKTTGYVGIGTTAPGAMLEVRGSYAAGRGHINVIDSAPFAAGVGGRIALMGEYQTGSNVPFGIIAGYKESATSGDFKGGIIFQTLPGSGTMTEGMRITPVGNVGIGTATPSDTLMVRPPSGQAGITIRNQTNTISNESTLTMLHASNGYGWRVRARDADGGVQLDVEYNTTWTNGVLTVNSSNGYVGIGGAPAPTAPLLVVGPAGPPSLTSDTSNLLIQTSSATQLAIGGEAAGPYAFWIQTKYAGNNGAVWPLALNPSGGSVGIGILHPGCPVTGALHVFQKGSLFGTPAGNPTAPATTDANILLYMQSANNWAGIGSDVSGDIWFRTGTGGTPDARMMIGNAGGVAIGMTSVAYQLNIGTDSAAKPGTNTWTVASDLRVKRDIAPFTEGLETILKLRPIAFAYNGEDETPEGYRSVGLIAQEVAEVAPSFIRRAPGKIAGEETEVLGLNTGDLTWMIVNALREIDARLRKLEN